MGANSQDKDRRRAPLDMYHTLKINELHLPGKNEMFFKVTHCVGHTFWIIPDLISNALVNTNVILNPLLCMLGQIYSTGKKKRQLA